MLTMKLQTENKLAYLSTKAVRKGGNISKLLNPPEYIIVCVNTVLVFLLNVLQKDKPSVFAK